MQACTEIANDEGKLEEGAILVEQQIKRTQKLET